MKDLEGEFLINSLSNKYIEKKKDNNI